MVSGDDDDDNGDGVVDDDDEDHHQQQLYHYRHHQSVCTCVDCLLQVRGVSFRAQWQKVRGGQEGHFHVLRDDVADWIRVFTTGTILSTWMSWVR